MLSFGDAQRIYIATMHPFDEESHKRIERHQKMRAGKGFETVECYTGLKNVKLPAGCVVLLECMSNLTANEMFEEAGAGSSAFEAVKEGIEALCDFCGQVVVVTNEVCSETAKDSREMSRYKELLGSINRRMANRAVQVTEVVYGIPLSVKEPENGTRSGRKSSDIDMRMSEEMMKQEKRKGVTT